MGGTRCPSSCSEIRVVHPFEEKSKETRSSPLEMGSGEMSQCSFHQEGSGEMSPCSFGPDDLVDIWWVYGELDVVTAVLTDWQVGCETAY